MRAELIWSFFPSFSWRRQNHPEKCGKSGWRLKPGKMTLAENMFAVCTSRTMYQGCLFSRKLKGLKVNIILFCSKHFGWDILEGNTFLTKDNPTQKVRKMVTAWVQSEESWRRFELEHIPSFCLRLVWRRDKSGELADIIYCSRGTRRQGYP